MTIRAHFGKADRRNASSSRCTTHRGLSDPLNWTVAQLAELHTLDTLTERVATSRRKFTRRSRELRDATVG